MNSTIVFVDAWTSSITPRRPLFKLALHSCACLPAYDIHVSNDNPSTFVAVTRGEVGAQPFDNAPLANTPSPVRMGLSTCAASYVVIWADLVVAYDYGMQFFPTWPAH